MPIQHFLPKVLSWFKLCASRCRKLMFLVNFHHFYPIFTLKWAYDVTVGGHNFEKFVNSSQFSIFYQRNCLGRSYALLDGVNCWVFFNFHHFYRNFTPKQPCDVIVGGYNFEKFVNLCQLRIFYQRDCLGPSYALLDGVNCWVFSIFIVFTQFLPLNGPVTSLQVAVTL